MGSSGCIWQPLREKASWLGFYTAFMKGYKMLDEHRQYLRSRHEAPEQACATAEATVPPVQQAAPTMATQFTPRVGLVASKDAPAYKTKKSAHAFRNAHAQVGTGVENYTNRGRLRPDAGRAIVP
ncbi:uncharacterized protein DFL_005510 [Arthrobotrys flagrans]|uniref:Uncharacterized protein n=1 Tax=Arthrobotrys flagrans TaxID=97331 RepID=A0A436ZY50_ARTFL|nr:hypothetical protein DFL_005510 [Arthrobotrys flagrans]